MAAFGAGNNGAAQVSGAIGAAPAANPWDMGGLDPVPLMPGSGISQLQVHLLQIVSFIMKPGSVSQPLTKRLLWNRLLGFF